MCVGWCRDTQKVFQIFQLHVIDGSEVSNAVSLTQVERLVIMHFGEISIVAGRVNKKAGDYIHDVYI